MFKKISTKFLIIALPLLLTVVIGYSPVQAQISNLLAPKKAANDFILSWSADSYVPADYEGKALPTRNSQIRVAAEPAKKLPLDPDKLYYNWSLDDDYAGYASGLGKSVLRFQVTKWTGDTHIITLQVKDANDILLDTSVLSITIVDPQLLLTKQNEDYALQNSLSTGTGQEIKFFAVPLFFHIRTLADIDWQWSFAGQNLTNPDDKNPNLLDLKIPPGKLSQTLEKNLSLNIFNKGDQFQQAAASLDIQLR